jgi:hypothetical protein
MLPSSSEVVHLVVIPVVNESPSVVEANVLSILRNEEFVKKTVIVLAVESRAQSVR